MGGSQHVRRSRQEKNRGFGAYEAPDSGHSGLTGRFEAVSRMRQSATLTRRPPTEFRGERGSNQVPITVKSISPVKSRDLFHSSDHNKHAAWELRRWIRVLDMKTELLQSSLKLKSGLAVENETFCSSSRGSIPAAAHGLRTAQK